MAGSVLPDRHCKTVSKSCGGPHRFDPYDRHSLLYIGRGPAGRNAVNVGISWLNEVSECELSIVLH